ncbi:MAG: protein kinase [Planctomycetes bacterium]|nr:protein kinase [Planctomycetota bacterium]
MAVDPLRIFGLLEDMDLAPSGEIPELGRAQPPAPKQPVADGALIGGRFRVKSGLGQGAFGDVLRATDLTLNRDVAIKLLRRADPQMRARFLREARATASLQHPNVLSVFQVGEHEERPYIVYELIEGSRDLAQAFADTDMETRLDLFERALAGVAAAHAQGIVHRDLKPENILVTDPGRVYVADFGIAQVAESSLTATGQFLGTPAYMAPEQVVGEETSPATDVWALGQILYQALYQTSWLKEALTIQELISRICSAKFNPPTKSDVPPRVAKVLFEQVLRRDVKDRLPNAQAFLEQVQLARGRGAAVAAAGRRGVASVLWVLVGVLSGAIVTAGLLRPSASPGASVSSAPTPVLASPTPALVPPTPALVVASPILSPPLGVEAPVSAPTEPLVAHGTSAYYALRRRFKLASTEEVRVEAERGQLAAMRVLGRRLFVGWRSDRDIQTARAWLERAASAGCPDSMEDLSRTYVFEAINAQSSSLSESQARWHARALEAGALRALAREHLNEKGVLPLLAARVALARGDEEAGFIMGQLFFGIGLRERSLDWLAASIALGCPEARGLRARLELLNRTPNFALAIADLRAGMSVGDATSFEEYARCLIRGRGVPQDLREARRLLTGAGVAGARGGDLAYFKVLLSFKEEADLGAKRFELDSRVELCAQRGSSYAQGELALLLLQITSRTQLEVRVRGVLERLFRGATHSFNPAVHVRFGLALHEKRLQSSEAPYVEAARAFRRAATLGAPLGWLNWGTSLVRGFGVEQDIDQGIVWLERASRIGLIKAQTNLGHLYADSASYPKHYDFERAIEYLLVAQRGGEEDAVRALGIELLKKEGNDPQARRLFTLAAEQGDGVGAYHLAQLLLSGRGGPKDEVGAVAVLEKVSPTARTRQLCELLADCYAEGRGVSADPKAADLWRSRAKALPPPTPRKASD